jgi:hypothetical protein
MGLLSMGALGVAAPKIKEKLGKNAGFALGVAPGVMYKNRKDKKENALQEGQARVAAASAPKVTPTPMSVGGRATHKMPDGKRMAGASHKMGHGGKVKGSSSSVSKRADGCATKGKTRGKMV